jgi:hypothetical protein
VTCRYTSPVEQVECFIVDAPIIWSMRKGCSHHMKIKNSCDSITFCDNNKGKIIGYGKIAFTTKHSILKVLFVDLLDYNLLSMSQLYEMDYNYLFINKDMTIFRRSDDLFSFKGSSGFFHQMKWNLTHAYCKSEPRLPTAPKTNPCCHEKSSQAPNWGTNRCCV